MPVLPSAVTVVQLRYFRTKGCWIGFFRAVGQDEGIVLSKNKGIVLCIKFITYSE